MMRDLPKVTMLDTGAAILLMIGMVSLMISFLVFKHVQLLPSTEADTQQEESANH